MRTAEAGRPPQQARSVASRRRLLDATISSVIERGYAATSTSEVAKRAELSQGALYKHFPSKAALMAATAEHLFGRLIDDYRRGFHALASEQITDVEARLRATLDLLWDLFHDAPLAAALELYVAARTDAELALAIQPIYARHVFNLRLEAARLFPELAGHPDVDSVIAGLMASLQGTTVATPVIGGHEVAGPKRLAERAFIERVFTTECRRMLETMP
ncbi:MAG: TetR/AcrR family transcriptional regulator [Myxococcota bacterium]